MAIHGAEDYDEVVYVGGRNEYLKQKMIEKLKKAGFPVKKDTTNHSGRDPENICNKCMSMEGLQLEISNGIRKKLFKGLKRNNRNPTSKIFNEFVKSIRGVLCEYATRNNLAGPIFPRPGDEFPHIRFSDRHPDSARLGAWSRYDNVKTYGRW